MTPPPPPSLPCPVCREDRYVPFFELPGIPTQDGKLWPSKAEALRAQTGDIRLAFCHGCGYIGNQLFDPSKIAYDDEYTFSMFFSPTFRDFLTAVANRLIGQYDLHGKSILEIACGEGDFIRLLCQLGGNHGLGIDPTTRARVEEGEGYRIEYSKDWYSERHANLAVDFVCIRQALDQLPAPKAMVELVRRNLGARRSPFYVEVPNAEAIFVDLLIRNIMYEKSSWFTARSLSRLFALSGFRVLSVEPCFDAGQYLALEAVPDDTVTADDPRTAPAPEFVRAIETFAARHDEKLAAWRAQLASLTSRGKRIMAWGSGAGAVNFLGSLGVRDEVTYVADINPRRQGRFIPVTGQEVVAPSFVPQYKPDVVIVTNATFEREIARQLSELGVTCELWTL